MLVFTASERLSGGLQPGRSGVTVGSREGNHGVTAAQVSEAGMAEVEFSQPTPWLGKSSGKAPGISTHRHRTLSTSDLILL